MIACSKISCIRLKKQFQTVVIRHLFLQRVSRVENSVGISYFIPKTDNSFRVGKLLKPEDDFKPSKKIPHDYQLIYKYPYSKALNGMNKVMITTFIVCGAFVVKGFMQMIYNDTDEMKEIEDKETIQNINVKTVKCKEEQEVATLFNRIPDFKQRDRYIAVAISVVATAISLFFMSRCVVAMYSNGNNFITIFNKLFINEKIIKHTKQDLVFYPERNVFRHEIKGRKVIILDD